eukprot:GHVQ01027127.1.p2 GENE.GHVQ01027127.1~~GHVQ01027127.1.p2  ORF type:complete len:128 (+),score=14.24 GHVQ01027127.1:1283-1666(+)
MPNVSNRHTEQKLKTLMNSKITVRQEAYGRCSVHLLFGLCHHFLVHTLHLLGPNCRLYGTTNFLRGFPPDTQCTHYYELSVTATNNRSFNMSLAQAKKKISQAQNVTNIETEVYLMSCSPPLPSDSW